MNEAEWLRSGSAQPMLAHLRGCLRQSNPPVPQYGSPQCCTGRKIALFVLAICSRVQYPPPNKPTLLGLHALNEVAEGRQTLDAATRQLVDITARLDEFESIAGQYYPFYQPTVHEPHQAFWIARKSAIVRAWELARDAILRDDPEAFERFAGNWKTTGLELPEWQVAHAQEEHVQADLLRDIIGNPFRPVFADPSWLTSTVVALAEGIYQEKAFDRMPILADALMDAGCADDDVLTHCRSDGPHVRGCWVVDLLTGRA
jgi:hypothetical protein